MAKKNDVRMPGMKSSGSPRHSKKKKGNAPAKTSRKGNGTKIKL